VALVARLPYLWTVPSFTDESREILRALQIMRGEEVGLVNVDGYIGGLYNWALAIIFWVLGPSPYAPRLVVAVAGALTAALAYGFGRDVAGRLAGLVAGCLVATSSSLILSNGHIAWSHCLTPLFTTLAAWLLHRAVRLGSRRALLGAGFTFGVAMQTHPATLVLLPGAAIYLLRHGAGWLRTRWAYLALVLFFVALANMLVHNAVTAGGSIRDAEDIRERYSRGRGIVADAATYAQNQVTHGRMLLRYLGGAVDARDSYLFDPVIWASTTVAIAGLVTAARRGAALPLFMTVSSIIIMPYFNDRKYVPISDGRYLMPILPLVFVGVGTLAAALWASRRRLVRATVGLAIAFLALWPLVPLQRYFDQELAAGETNHAVFATLQATRAARQADEAVLLDSKLGDIKQEGGGTAFRSLRYLFATSGLPERSIDDPRDAVRRLSPGESLLMVHAPTTAQRTASELRLPLPFGQEGIRGTLVHNPGGGGYPVYRLGRDTAATATQQQASAPAGRVPVEVAATGLINPRGLLFRPDGSLLVAEAGNGGNRLVDVGREKPQPMGRSGQVTRFTPGWDRALMLRELPSIVTAVGEEVGPSALAIIGDQTYLLLASGGWDVGDPTFNSGIFRLTPEGRAERIFDFSAFTLANPTRARLEDSRADVPAGMPYGMTAADGKLYVTDGNQEQIVEVSTSGEARRVADYPRSNRALTGVATGPDGALYVAEFAASKVTRVDPRTGEITDAATKLRTPIGVTFDSTGQMYILEYSGRVLRAAPVGQDQRDVIAEGLREPTAITFGPDGNLYASVNGHHAGRGEGQVVRLRLVPRAPDPWRRVGAALTWASGLVVLALFFAIAYRFRAGRARVGSGS
jgi:hypothetical protein